MSGGGDASSRASHHRGGSGGSNGSLSAISSAHAASASLASTPSTSVFGSSPSPLSSAHPFPAKYRKPNKHYRAHLNQRIRATMATADGACALNDEQFGSHELIMTELRVRMRAEACHYRSGP